MQPRYIAAAPRMKFSVDARVLIFWRCHTRHRYIRFIICAHFRISKQHGVMDRLVKKNFIKVREYVMKLDWKEQVKLWNSTWMMWFQPMSYFKFEVNLISGEINIP